MKCEVCDSLEVYPYKKVDGVSIFQCKKCLLAFVDPSTPRKNTNEIYSFADYKKREEQFKQRYINTVKLLNKYTRGKHVLEVGAGFGLLSSLIAREGYHVDALEPAVTPHYLENTSAVTIIKKTFNTFAEKTTKKYDAIILYDVLEHVDNPKETVLLFQKLLNKNGIVFVQTPNYLSYMARIVKHWSWWMVEDHRFFFSKKSLSLLFSQKIWKEKHFSTYEDWFDFKKNLDGNFGRNKNAKYIFFLWWIPYYFLLRRFIWAGARGGLITVIYQKK
ncbi:MAG: class I SAM-dependent methyltransferase [bacterium]